MHSRKKIVLAILVLGAIGVFWYFNSKKEIVETAPTVTPQAKAVQWSRELKDLEPELVEAFTDISVGERADVRIEKEIDLTGDGVTEALVSLGTGGASTSFFTIARIRNGEPVPARFKLSDGTVSELAFLEGGSAMHSDTLVLVPEDTEVYSGSIMRSGDEGLIDTCEVSVYTWNEQTEVFEYSASRSARTQTSFCSSQISALTS